MPTINATPSSPTANSFATLAQGTTYFDERLQATNWTGDSDPDVKARALIMATRRLDQLTYVGYKSSTDQALEWPRSDVYDKDGEEYASAAIPTFLVEATLELALHYLNKNAESTDPHATDGLERFDRAKVGPLEVEPNHSRVAGEIPTYILAELAHVTMRGPWLELVRS